MATQDMGVFGKASRGRYEGIEITEEEYDFNRIGLV